jgi:hypothetical protein
MLSAAVVAPTIVAARADGIVVESGGAAQHSIRFHHSEHKLFDHTVETFSQDFWLPEGTRLVGVDQSYARREHLVPFPDAPAAPRLQDITRTGDVTTDIARAAGVRISVRLEAGPKIKLVGKPPFQKPDPFYAPFDGILEGSLTLRYVDGSGASQGHGSSGRTEFVTAGGSRFLKGAGREWTEFRTGAGSSRFTEVRRTDTEIELFDAKRVMYVMISAERGYFRMTSSEPWRPWNGSEGRWTR